MVRYSQVVNTNYSVFSAWLHNIIIESVNVCFVKILVGFFRKYLDSYVLYALRTYFIATAFSANPKEVAKFFEWYPSTHHSFRSYSWLRVVRLRETWDGFSTRSSSRCVSCYSSFFLVERPILNTGPPVITCHHNRLSKHMAKNKWYLMKQECLFGCHATLCQENFGVAYRDIPLSPRGLPRSLQESGTQSPA